MNSTFAFLDSMTPLLRKFSELRRQVNAAVPQKFITLFSAGTQNL